MPQTEPQTLEDEEWDTLLKAIQAEKCTPFLGAGACKGILPLGSEIAQDWAKNYKYPLEDCYDLVRVAQFLAVERDPMFPKDEMVKLFIDHAVPDFNNPDEPHRVLADLHLPIYMTTNYCDIMLLALKSRGKDPKRELCHWNQDVNKYDVSIFQSDFKPSPEKPVIFHLHGHHEMAESLVLTEDDYLDFLVNNARDGDMLPHWIQRALSGTSLLFLGYRMADLSFRVLFRGFVTSRERSLRRMGVTVQLPIPKLEDEIYLKNGDKITGQVIKQNEENSVKEKNGDKITSQDKEQGEEYIVIETEAMGVISICNECIDRIVAGKEARQEAQEKQQKYLDKYFKEMNMKVYWGEAEEFASELRERWEDFQNQKRNKK